MPLTKQFSLTLTHFISLASIHIGIGAALILAALQFSNAAFSDLIWCFW